MSVALVVCRHEPPTRNIPFSSICVEVALPPTPASTMRPPAWSAQTRVTPSCGLLDPQPTERTGIT